MRVIFWNIYGYEKNIKSITDKIKSSDIVCLCESWHLKQKVQLCKKLKDFCIVQSVAKKQEGRGRPSGGMITSFNEKVYQKIEEIVSDDYIIVLLKSEETKKKICVCSCYARSKTNITEYWEKFADDLRKIEVNKETPLVVVGDFNSRVGTLNSYGEFVNMYGLTNERTTMDKERDRRGQEYVECIEQLGLMILNGRTKSDSPANFTYIEKKGMSVIDLALCRYNDAEYIEDFRTMQIVSGSDHDAIEVKIKFQEKTREPVEGIKWKLNKKKAYRAEMEVNIEKIKGVKSIKEKNSVISETIIKVAKKIGMWTRQVDKGEYECEWFDKECAIMKKEVKKNGKR